MNESESAVRTGSDERGQRSARALVRLNLTVLGGGFAWFAFIDAPITDGAMRVFAASVVAALLSTVAALISSESEKDRVSRRARRLALWLFVLATALMLMAATATLNLKGTGDDESETRTAWIIPAGRR